jgi:uncharacterized protein (TIGR02996 family)
VTDGQALILSVLANPADDAPRLVYADWLEERGRAEDAEFIRVQIELARRGFGGALRQDQDGHLRYPPDMERLTTRQTQLWYAGHGRPDLPDGMANWPMALYPTPVNNLLVHRGFIERIAVFTDAFLKVAGGLFARQPVTHVRLVDRQPSATRKGFSWIRNIRTGRLDQVPDELWLYLGDDDETAPDFSTADEAEAAVSWACVRYGRAQAGLD